MPPEDNMAAGDSAKLDRILEQVTEVRIDMAEVKTTVGAEVRRVDSLERRVERGFKEPLATKAELDAQGDAIRAETDEKADARQRRLIAWLGVLIVATNTALAFWDHLVAR